jgi:hypothetical protein
MSQPLTQEQFDKLTEDLPADGFSKLVPLVYESFAKKRGRTLDRTQVATLAVALMEMSATIDAQISHIGELQAQVEAKKAGNKLWKPKG